MTKQNSNDELEEPFRSMMTTFASPEMQAMLREIYKVVGYLPPFRLRRMAQMYHDAVNAPETSQRFDWRSKRSVQWQRQALDIVYHLRMALMATNYHAENLVKMEGDLQSVGKRFDLQQLGGSVLGGGENHLRIDFEFHSFIIAFRRTIDQLARLLFACAKSHVHSFNDIEKLFEQRHFERFTEPAHLRELLIPARSDFRFCISDGSNKTMRDRIVHNDYVSSGTVNVSVSGITLFNPEIGTTAPIAISDFCNSKLDQLLLLLEGVLPSVTTTSAP